MKTPIRLIFILSLFLIILVQIVFLMPSSLESQRSAQQGVELAQLTLEVSEGPVLAPGIPTHTIPDYQIEKFKYTSTLAGKPEWRILAQETDVYGHKDRLVHAKQVVADLFQSNGEITHVVGKEAKYVFSQRNLEIFGDVETVLPDGFTIQSAYMKYLPQEKKIIVPTEYRVVGFGKTQDTPNAQTLRFTSGGLEYPMRDPIMTLPSQAQFILLPPPQQENQKPTTITSDVAHIFHQEKIAKFSMYPNRTPQERFVWIDSPDWKTKSRLADLSYGDRENPLNYLIAYQDVKIDEAPLTENAQPRWATSGRANFDQKMNRVILTESPQVYQDKDTVTGEKITLYRDSDIVEVEQSNAFNEGKSKSNSNTQSSPAREGLQGP